MLCFFTIIYLSSLHLKFQAIQGTHCLYFYKGLASWVAYMDIDEYFQPIDFQSTDLLVKYLEHTKGLNTIANIVVYGQFWFSNLHQESACVRKYFFLFSKNYNGYNE